MNQTDPEASTAIRWGILGCGDVCEVKSGPGFQKARGSRLVAVMRRDPDKAQDFARRHGVPKWTSDAHELIHDPEVDAVYIATPPGSHRDLALAVAAAGKPCYVEKPMARTHAECQDMLGVFEKQKLPLFVAYYRRCLPRFVTTKEMLSDKALGPLIHIDYQFSNSAYLGIDPGKLPWRLQPEHSGGGLLHDLGSHLIDLLDHLFGPLQKINGFSRNVGQLLELPDQTEFSFRTIQGVPGKARWNFASRTQTDLLTITGERGTLRLSCFGNEPLQLEKEGHSATFDRPHPPHVHQPLIQTMVDQLRGFDVLCSSTGESAARTSRIIDLISATPHGI